jgi:KDO2-lipid IV(A) lauroyltransferase
MVDNREKQHQAAPARSQRFTSAGSAFVANIPLQHIVNIGRLLGILVFWLDVPHRRIVRRNLQFTYPDWSSDEIRTISRRIFQNLAITVLEIFQMSFFSCEDILARIKTKGEDHLTQALEDNKGLILISAHLGNWEAGLQFTSCFLQRPCTGVVKKIRFRPLNRWLTRLRTRFGLEAVNKKGALPKMRQALRMGEVMGLLIDQSKRSESVDVRFYGKKVTTTPAAALLAFRCKSPVLPLFCIREPNGQLLIQVDPPLDLKRTNDLRSDLIANTQMMTDVIEKMIRQHTDQWLWPHKRWKKHYPQLYPEYFARRRRRKEREKKRAAAENKF